MADSIISDIMLHLFKKLLPWLVWLSGLSAGLRTKESPI